MHAASDVAFDVGGRCTRCTAVLGVDDEVGGSGTVTVAVVTDGVTRYTSATLSGSSSPVTVNVDVTGAQVLRPVVGDGGNGVGEDHADWADARVICSS